MPPAIAWRMTAPRLLSKGTTYLVTRRCLRRKFLLRPGKVTNAVFGYLLARAAARSGIKVHAYCVLSNHFHLVLTDPTASLPLFHQYLDSLVARATNALYGLWDTFWDPDSYNATVLDSAEDVVDRCAYVLANPVAAGLVHQARKWPGLWSSPADVGRRMEIERPKHFFDPNGYMPERIAFTLAVPPGFESAEAFRLQLEAALASREARAFSKHQRFFGVARILKQRVLARPGTPERRPRLRPRFAARNPGRRLELAGRLRAFLAEYRDALVGWREGNREVVFPDGTYLMRVMHLATCAGAG
jgi:REP element-mobilizing transposase RayT